MEWMPVLSKVLEAILIAILPPLVVALITFLIVKAKEAWARAKAWNPLVTEYLEKAAKFAVQAAEQAGAAELIKDKKEYAIQIAEAWLVANHITTDIDLIDAAIEKAVLELFNSGEKKQADIWSKILYGDGSGEPVGILRADDLTEKDSSEEKSDSYQEPVTKDENGLHYASGENVECSG